MEIKFEETFGPITEKDILAFEELHNLKFPKDYREFLRQYNGAFQEEPFIIQLQIGKKNKISSLNTLASIVRIDSSVFVPLENPEEMPPFNQFFPIAIDVGSSSFLISLRDNDYGSVYFWDSNYEFETKDKPRQSVYFVAPSFTEFLGSLMTQQEFQIQVAKDAPEQSSED